MWPAHDKTRHLCLGFDLSGLDQDCNRPGTETQLSAMDALSPISQRPESTSPQPTRVNPVRWSCLGPAWPLPRPLGRRSAPCRGAPERRVTKFGGHSQFVLSNASPRPAADPRYGTGLVSASAVIQVQRDNFGNRQVSIADYELLACSHALSDIHGTRMAITAISQGDVGNSLAEAAE